jgi:hypothetical protein
MFFQLNKTLSPLQLLKMINFNKKVSLITPNNLLTLTEISALLEPVSYLKKVKEISLKNINKFLAIERV